MLRPGPSASTYTVVLRFDHDDNLRQWVESDVRKALIGRVQPLLAREEEVEILTGLEYWFTPPAGEQKRARPVR